MQMASDLRRQIASYVLISAVVLSPLPFGSTDQISIAFWTVILAIVSVAILPPFFTKAEFVFLGCAAVLAAAWCVTIYVQLSPSEVLDGFFDNPIWPRASEAMGIKLPAGVSVARNQAFYSAAPQLACFLALFSGFMAGRDRETAKRVLHVTAIAAAAYAALSISLFAIDPTVVLWRQKLAYRTVLTGTFTNRNTAAIYFGSFGVIWLLVLSERLSKDWPRHARNWIDGTAVVLRRPSRAAVRAAISLLLVLSAMFMTGSRAGVLLSLGAMLGAALTFYRRKLSSAGAVVGALVLGGVLTLVLLQLMGSTVTDRFNQSNAADFGRLYAYRSTAAIIAQFPWFGTGLGTFPLIFPAYRSSEITTWGTWDRAHNTLLEIACEQGIPFSTVVLVGFLIMGTALAYGVGARRRGRITPLCAFWVGTLVAVHSLVDFSLQIPAVSILVFTLSGIGLAQSTQGTVSPSRSRVSSS
jgi:O-antigen ligase